MMARFQLKNFRLLKNYTQQYMADQLSISRQQYCKIENGKAEALSAGQKKTISELLDLPEDQVDIRGNITPFQVRPDHRYPDTRKDSQTEELFAALIEQNKKLILMLEQLSAKLNPART
ncbi:MAG: helix-turn-helix transcriptional regulator [Chitinophagaceae bacterium]|nr:helix-turn-helix transcriptional regulator [Chitinophagaceae bacterium]